MTRLFKGHLTGRVVTECGHAQVVADIILVQGPHRLEVEGFLETCGDRPHVVALVRDLRALYPELLLSTSVEYPD